MVEPLNLSRAKGELRLGSANSLEKKSQSHRITKGGGSGCGCGIWEGSWLTRHLGVSMTVEVTVRAEATRDISDTLLPAGQNFEELK
jgi:hypothetical protein